MALVPYTKGADNLITVEQINHIQKKQVEKWLKIYNKILSNCNSKIQKCVKQKENFCFYNLPVNKFGLPLYDTKKCSIYLIKKLREAKFIVSYIPPLTLFINWGKNAQDNALSSIKINNDIINNLNSPTKTVTEKEIYIENDRKSNANKFFLSNKEDKFLFT